jgi:hypothetical protein
MSMTIMPIACWCSRRTPSRILSPSSVLGNTHAICGPRIVCRVYGPWHTLVVRR